MLKNISYLVALGLILSAIAAKAQDDEGEPLPENSPSPKLFSDQIRKDLHRKEMESQAPELYRTYKVGYREPINNKHSWYRGSGEWIASRTVRDGLMGEPTSKILSPWSKHINY